PLAADGPADADRLTDQDLADEDQLALPPDLTVGANPPYDAVLAIHRLTQLTGIAPWRWPIERSGILELQGLVGSLGVEDPTEGIETGLLFGQTWRRQAELAER